MQNSQEVFGVARNNTIRVKRASGSFDDSDLTIIRRDAPASDPRDVEPANTRDTAQTRLRAHFSRLPEKRRNLPICVCGLSCRLLRRLW